MGSAYVIDTAAVCSGGLSSVADMCFVMIHKGATLAPKPLPYLQTTDIWIVLKCSASLINEMNYSLDENENERTWLRALSPTSILRLEAMTRIRKCPVLQ